MTKTVLIAVVLLLGAGVAAPASAQSLADVARKEEERRKEVKKPSRVLTNKDLKADPNAPATPAPLPADATAPAPDGDKTTSPDADKPAPAPSASPRDEEEQRQKDQAEWAKKAADARQLLHRNEMFLQALQSRINGLTADYTARDDPYQRAQLDLERSKAIADLEEDARKAGVPPGWLR
jgi:hypothetical protein